MLLELDQQTAMLIRDQVDAGRYASDSDVVRAAVRLLEERQRLETLRVKIDEGWREMERGEALPYTPDLFQQILESSRLRAQAGDEPHPDVCP